MARKLVGFAASRLLPTRRTPLRGRSRDEVIASRAAAEAEAAQAAAALSEEKRAAERWSTFQIGAVMAAITLGARLIMMYDESQEPKRIARRAREFAEDQENLKPLTDEQWEKMTQIHPLTPFEGSIDTSTARIRRDSLPSLGEVGDWAADSLAKALRRNEQGQR